MTRILEIAWHLVIEEQKNTNAELDTPQQSAACVAAVWTREIPTPLLVTSSLSLCMLSFTTVCGRHVFWLLLFRDEVSQCNVANLGPIWPQAHSNRLASASLSGCLLTSKFIYCLMILWSHPTSLRENLVWNKYFLPGLVSYGKWNQLDSHP